MKLTTDDFTEKSEPFALFDEWLAEAAKTEPNDPNAVALATVDSEGLPDVRMVLLKGFDSQGFVFFTNFESQKGQEILGSMKAAMCFHWKISSPSSAYTWSRRDRQQRRGRCLLCNAPARKPYWRVGIKTISSS